MDFIELSSKFFDKIKIGDNVQLDGYNYEFKKGRKKGELISKFIVVRTDLKTNKKVTFSIYEKYGSRFSNNYKKKEHNPFNSLVRNIEGVLIVDIINSNNPLHENSEIYNICAL